MYDDQALMLIGMIIYIGIPAAIIAGIFYWLGKRNKK